jgi:hypothetical protein
MGSKVLSLVKVDFLDRSSDRLIIAKWLGMVIVGVLLTFSIFNPTPFPPID